jgi:hypothetical protein
MADGWHGVSYSKIAEAGAICGGVALVVGVALQAGVFHRFQKKTPGTWRAEGPSKYALSVVCRLLVGVGFPLLYIYTGMGAADAVRTEWLTIGLKMGLLTWMAAALPLTLSMATFVNLHKGVVLGLILDWAVVCLACGVICAKILQF